MNNKFDQLAKGVAQSVTRRQALKRFGLGLATIALAGFGFKARAINECISAGSTCDPDANPDQTHSCCNYCSLRFIPDPNHPGKFVCQVG